MITSLLLVSLVATGAEKTALLNPHFKEYVDLQIPFIEEVDASAQTKWLKAAVKELSLPQSFVRLESRDVTHEAVEAEIEKISQDYLELRFSKAGSRLDQLITQIQGSLPYAEMHSDILKISAFENLIYSEFPKYQIKFDTNIYVQTPEFLDLVNSSLRRDLSSRPLRMTSVDSALLTETPQIFLNGKKISANQKVAQGQYWAHRIDHQFIRAGWMQVAGGMSFKEVWSVPVWTSLKKSEIANALTETRISEIPHTEVALLSLDANQMRRVIQMRLGKPVAQAKTVAQVKRPVQKPKTTPIEITPQKPLDPASPDWAEIMDKEEESDLAFLKSPVFWGVVAVAAGVGGYFIYDSTRTQRIKTP
jgi:hypothetical protein